MSLWRDVTVIILCGLSCFTLPFLREISHSTGLDSHRSRVRIAVALLLRPLPAAELLCAWPGPGPSYNMYS